jgi:hypothetical protein
MPWNALITPPHRAEQADEGRRARRGGQEGQIALHAGDLDGGAAPHRAIDRVQAIWRQPVLRLRQGMLEHLAPRQAAGGLLAAGDVELRQGAIPVLPRGDKHRGQVPALAKVTKKGHGFAANLSELPPFLDDERPADDGEETQEEEDELRDGPSIEDELHHARIEAAGSWHSGLLCRRSTRGKHWI